MKFAHVQILLLLWVLPLLALVLWRGMRRRYRILSAFATEKTRRVIIRDAPGMNRHEPAAPEPVRRHQGRSNDFSPDRLYTNRLRMIGSVLSLATLALMIFAMAGPQYGYKWQEIRQKGIDIVIALDCSKSMLAADIDPTRLHRAKREILDLLALLQGDRAGLVAFAGTAFMQCPLTLDYNAFNLFLNALTPDFMPLGGTDLAGAITAAVAGFESESRTEKAVILITDGESTDGDAVKAAEAAAKAGIRIFCIGVGKADGIPIPDPAGGFKKDAAGHIILTRINEDELKRIAVLTGGTYVRSVAGDMDLDVIYHREIREKMNASTLAGGRKKVWEDRFQWFLGAALVCLLMEMFRPFFRKVLPLMLLTSAMLLSGVLPVRAESIAQTLQQGLEAYEKGEYETALNAFIKTQLNDPERPEIYYDLGNTYYKLGQYDEAKAQYRKALTDNDPSLRQKTLYNLGNAEFRAGNFKDALLQYEAALKLNPHDEKARKNIDFVKKVMEEQQKQPPSTDGRQSPDQSPETSSQEQKQQRHQDGQQDREQPRDHGDGQQGTLRNKPSPASRPDENKQGQNPEQGDTSPPEERTQKQDTPNDEHSHDSSAQNRERASSGEQGENGASPPQPMRAPSAETDEPQNGEPGHQAGGRQTLQMLNRLEDKPGRAMIPVYRKRVVDKDW